MIWKSGLAGSYMHPKLWRPQFCLICKMGVFENLVREGVYMVLAQCLPILCLLSERALTTFLFSELSLEKESADFSLFSSEMLLRKKESVTVRQLSLGLLHLTMLCIIYGYGHIVGVLESCPVLMQVGCK